jgi:hypothetical protein
LDIWIIGGKFIENKRYNVEYKNTKFRNSSNFHSIFPPLQEFLDPNHLSSQKKNGGLHKIIKVFKFGGAKDKIHFLTLKNSQCKNKEFSEKN